MQIYKKPQKPLSFEDGSWWIPSVEAFNKTFAHCYARLLDELEIIPKYQQVMLIERIAYAKDVTGVHGTYFRKKKPLLAIEHPSIYESESKQNENENENKNQNNDKKNENRDELKELQLNPRKKQQLEVMLAKKQQKRDSLYIQMDDLFYELVFNASRLTLFDEETKSLCNKPAIIRVYPGIYICVCVCVCVCVL